MYVAGEPIEVIAKHFGVSISATARKVYDYKKEQTK
jgi:Zn-dependent peptidase ImmA (M78 family)